MSINTGIDITIIRNRLLIYTIPLGHYVSNYWVYIRSPRPASQKLTDLRLNLVIYSPTAAFGPIGEQSRLPRPPTIGRFHVLSEMLAGRVHA